MLIYGILAVSMFSCASASHLAYGNPGPLKLVSTGTSSQYRSEDNYGNYQFGYDEAHATGSTSRREEQLNGVRRGSYSLSDADGRRRTVHYIADSTGFHASILTNEPGVEPKDSADVSINKVGGEVLFDAPVPAPAPVPLPAPVFEALAAPLNFGSPLGTKTVNYGAPRLPIHAPLPASVAGAEPAPIYGEPAGPLSASQAYVEHPAPRAFGYAFDSTHVAPVAAVPAPVYEREVSAPIFQQAIKGY